MPTKPNSAALPASSSGTTPTQKKPSESGLSTVTCVDVPRPPLMAVAREQFARDRHDLLKTARGRFVAYHGTRRLKVVDTLAEGYAAGFAEQLPRDEIAVLWIEDYESPQEIDFSAAAN